MFLLRRSGVPLHSWHSRDATLTEWLDETEFGERDLRQNLRDIRQINALLGWTAYATRVIATLTRAAPRRPWTVLDVASGSADIPLAIARWAQRAQMDMTMIASDISPQIVAIAREQCRSMPHMRVEQLDALALPYAAGSMDIVLCTLAFHHFAPDSAVALLRSMARVGRHVLVFDVVRSQLAYMGVIALTRLTGMHAMTCHDAPISVRRAYSAGELRHLARQAGLTSATVQVGFPFRLMLSAPGFTKEPAHAL